MLILEGIAFGLALAVSIGPIFFALVQTSLRQGLAAGVFVGTGIWVSDFLYIIASYFGISQLHALKGDPQFTFWFGLLGGLFLFGFGLALFFKKPPGLEQLRQPSDRESSVLLLWAKGFLVNTANPFTIFFWFVTMTNGVIERQFSPVQVLQFFGGILGIIILTDFLKAYFADALRRKLMPVHLKWFGWLGGVIVMGFGVVIIWKGVFGTM